MNILSLMRKLAPLAICALTCVVAAKASGASPAEARLALSLENRPMVGEGESATQLPDGRWLLLGGLAIDGSVSASAKLLDTKTGNVLPLKSKLNVARTGHSASLLPDGTVLILGGESATGDPLSSAERYDPKSQIIDRLQDLGILPRSFHTATVMLDGRVLLVGGVGTKGQIVDQAELISRTSLRSEPLNARLVNGRYSHSASLLPDDQILIGGGLDEKRQKLAGVEVFDYGVERFIEPEQTAIAAWQLTLGRPPFLAASFPVAGSINVELDARIALKFSKRLDVKSLSSETITLIGPHGAVPLKVVPAEAGVLVFATPSQDLLPSSRYTVFIQGAVDHKGVTLPLVSIAFATKAIGPSTPVSYSAHSATANVSARTGEYSAQRSGKEQVIPTFMGTKMDAAIDGDEVFVPGPQHHFGRWRTGRPLPAEIVAERNDALMRKGPIAYEHAFTSKKIILPRKGHVIDRTGTGVAGRVLRLNDRPLRNAEITIAGVTTRTDDKGYFRVENLQPGRHELFADGSHSGTGSGEYAKFLMGVDVKAGEITAMPPIFLPRVRKQDWIDIPSPMAEDIVLSHPNVPGMEIHIPKGAVLRGRDGKIVSRVALIPVPLDRIPFPFPENAPVYVSIQPAGMTVLGLEPGKTGAVRVVYPNLSRNAPGTPADFWRYDPSGKGWYVYGQGKASADGLQIIPNPNVVLYDSVGFMYTPSPSLGNEPPPSDAPPSCDMLAGDPVSCSSGLFLHNVTDISVKDITPLTVVRTYRPGDSQSRSFGRGASHPYAQFLSFPQAGSFQQVSLVQPSGTQLVFARTSPGSNYQDAIFEYKGADSNFFGSKMTYVPAAGRWRLDRRDGNILEFNAFGGTALASISDRHGNAVELIRSSGLLNRLVSSNGRTLDFTYDVSNRITSIVDMIGRTVSYEYNAEGYLHRAIDPLMQIEEYLYDSAGRMLSVKDKRGNYMVLNEYDPNGRVKKQTYADNSTFSFNYTLGADGKVTSVDTTDERGMITRSTFNSNRHVLTTTVAFGTSLAQTRSFEYDQFQLVRATVDSLGRRTETDYDSKGNVVQRRNQAGTVDQSVTSYTYEPIYNQVATSIDPAGKKTTISYDSKGDPKRIESGPGNIVETTYNTAGQPVGITTYAKGVESTTVYKYDAGDLISITDPLGKTTSFQVDVLGRTVSVANPLGGLNRVEFDKLDRQVRQIGPLGEVAISEFDPLNMLTKFTDPEGKTTAFTYDKRGRMLTKTDGRNLVESYAYDLGGGIVSLIDRTGRKTLFENDVLGRRIKTKFGATSASQYVSSTEYGWDVANRVISINDSVGGTITYGYDGSDQKISEISPQGRLDYTYLANGARESMTVLGQARVGYTWDEGNRLIAIKQAGATVELAYDESGRRTKVKFPSGLIEETYYDAAGQTTGISHERAGLAIGNLNYTYDASGRRITAGGSWTSYEAPVEAPTASYDQNNRLLSWGGSPLTYDDHGNLLGDGLRTYQWDERQRLVRTQTSSTVTTYRYDGLNRRIGKVVNGQGTNYLHDGVQVVQELNGSTPIANMLTGLAMDDIFRRNEGGVIREFAVDALGSTLALLDETGIVKTRYKYGNYGETASEGELSTNAFQYTGRENEGENLYYYRNRYYSAVHGRFIQSDPIGLAGGINTYGYAEGNPLMYNDPLGLFSAADLPSLPQGFVDSVVGFGDGVYSGVTLGIGDLNEIRKFAGIDGGVNTCSDLYGGFSVAGNVVGAAATGGAGWTRAMGRRTLGGSRLGHRGFTPNRKNGSWNTGKTRFGWSGRNGSNEYDLMLRHKGWHSPPITTIVVP